MLIHQPFLYNVLSVVKEPVLVNIWLSSPQAYQDMRKIILECEAEIYAVIGRLS